MLTKKKIIKKAGSVLSDSDLSKKYYGSGKASIISVLPEKALWIPSRHIYLNYTMGGGIPYGKICEIFGGESSGKTLVAMDFGYCTQTLGGVVLWNDAEQSFDPSWAEKNGLDLDRVILFPETSIEIISDWAADMAITYRSRLRNNEPILLVTDSTAALDCEANINSVQFNAKAEMGNRAKAIYKYLRIRNQMFAELGITLIFINQLRKKVGATMFEDPDCGFYDNIINFVDGRCLPIGKVVEEKIEGDIWSYNEKLNVFEPKPIVGWVKKEKLKPGEKWIEVKVKGFGNKFGTSGNIFTEKHGLLTQDGWKNVKDITLNDQLITKYTSLISGSLGEFLYGSFIGDSSLGYRENGINGNTTRYQLQDSENPEYLNWKLEKLSDYITFKKFKTVHEGKYKYKSDPSIEFRLIANQIKHRDPLLLWDLTKKLPPLTLALWYMDDGHISKGRNQMQISIAHSRTDIGKLIGYLSKQGFDCYKGNGSKNRNPKGIRFTVLGARNLSHYIREYVPECMQYKLLAPDRGFYRDFSLFSEPQYKPLPLEITYIGEANKKSYEKPYKYDITVADNHNFLAGGKSNGFIAHNTTPGGDAMKFYAHQRMAFFQKKQITDGKKENKVWLGNEVSVRMKKNKVAPPKPSFITEIYFNDVYHKVGFDKYSGLSQLLIKTDAVEVHKGKRGYWLGDKKIAESKEGLETLLIEDEDLRRKLIHKTGVNTISKTQRKINLLNEGSINRYPVRSKRVVKQSDIENKEEVEEDAE
jgi:recombination protein RecA